MAFKRLILVPFATAALSPFLHAQVKPQERQTKPAPLKLEVTPTKNVYTVGETVFVRYVFTSLVDGTLCFPEPAAEQTGPVSGYLKTDVTPPKRQCGDLFIDDVWPRYPTDEELRRDVADRWIRLGMSEPFHPKGKGQNLRFVWTGRVGFEVYIPFPRTQERQEDHCRFARLHCARYAGSAGPCDHHGTKFVEVRRTS